MIDITSELMKLITSFDPKKPLEVDDLFLRDTPIHRRNYNRYVKKLNEAEITKILTENPHFIEEDFKITYNKGRYYIYCGESERADLVGEDKNGNLTVVEVKRFAKSDSIGQVLQYKKGLGAKRAIISAIDFNPLTKDVAIELGIGISCLLPRFEYLGTSEARIIKKGIIKVFNKRLTTDLVRAEENKYFIKTYLPIKFLNPYIVQEFSLTNKGKMMLGKQYPEIYILKNKDTRRAKTVDYKDNKIKRYWKESLKFWANFKP